MLDTFSNREIELSLRTVLYFSSSAGDVFKVGSGLFVR